MNAQALAVEHAVEVHPFDSDKLSYYRTSHHFEAYAEIESVADYEQCVQWAASHGRDLYLLGNGSNTLFVREQVHSLIVKNALPRDIEPLPDHRLRVSSSVPLNRVLQHCWKERLNSFYYLSSVPGNVGGALAMNAGRGRDHNMTIYDFVESVTWWQDGELVTREAGEIERGYRHTPFTGMDPRLIVSAVLKFTPGNFTGSPIKERAQWTHIHQDNTKPNCGSVFKEADFSILKRLRGLHIGGARYSSETINWINNEAGGSRSIVMLIRLAQSLHVVMGKKAVPEVIMVR